MRQGPYYEQWVDRDALNQASLRLPLELEEDWKDAQTVTWKDNGDGSYMLIPNNTI